MAVDRATAIGARTARPSGDARIVDPLLEAPLNAYRAAPYRELDPFLGEAKAALRLVLENSDIINLTRVLPKMLDDTDDDDAIARSSTIRTALLHSWCAFKKTE